MKPIKEINVAIANKSIKTFILTGAILCNSATAQELAIPEAHYPQLPAYAKTAQGFVPHGWELQIKKSGDLNGDGRPDLLLVLGENNPQNIIEHDGMGENPFDANPRTLAVAFAKPNGGYALALQNHEIIERNVNPTNMEGLDVSIARGNFRVAVNVSSSFGTWWTNTKTFTFRYLKDGFKLIGYDHSSLHRATHEIDDISVNYLTGKIKKTTGTADDEEKVKVQWKKVPLLEPVPIADVDANYSPPYAD